MLTFTTTNPYSRALNGGLTLKSVATPADAERLIAFDGQIFGQDVAVMARSLLFDHPATRPDYWLYVEGAAGQIVSSLCLLPWTWRYDEVTLKVGEMGIVGTLESHRNRGLVRELTARFKELLREGQFDLSDIQGIPYFYRQFGYEYALPLESNWEIALHRIPDLSAEGYTVRPATRDDLPALMRLYDEAARQLNISAVRDADTWRYLLEGSALSAMACETWVFADAADQVVGYWRVPQHGFGAGLIVNETSRLSAGAAEVLLSWLKTTAVERGKSYVRFNLAVSNDLLRMARSYGAMDAGTYEWQIHIVEVARLLRNLTPVLERRIAASLFAGLSEKVVINLYREALELHFEAGKLLNVTHIGFSDGGSIHIPPNLFTPLVLGYRTHEELRTFYPDVNIRGSSRALVDVLFPKMEGFLYTNY